MATASTARRPTAPASCSPAASRRSKLTVSSGSIAYLPLRARLFLRLRSAEPASRLAAGTSVRLSRVQTVLCEGPPDRSRHLVGRKGYASTAVRALFTSRLAQLTMRAASAAVTSAAP